MGRFTVASQGDYALEKALTDLSNQVAPADGGNVYYVLQSSKAFAPSFIADHQKFYSDGSAQLVLDSGNGAGIQAAITACKGGRGDYIFVGTGSYQLTSALTLAGKSSVHLVSVNTQSVKYGAVGPALLQQTGNFACLIMEAYCEVAGFQFINKAGYSAITIADAKWRPNIHNNYFHMVQGTACSIIASAGSGMSHGYICNNRFNTWVAGAITSAIVLPGAVSATVAENMIVNYSGTMDNAIDMGSSVQCVVIDNVISDCGGAGTITNGIAIGNPTGNVAVGNRVGLPTGTAFSGGTANKSFVDNRDAQAGGATPVES
jgi:hypothetical protein